MIIKLCNGLDLNLLYIINHYYTIFHCSSSYRSLAKPEGSCKATHQNKLIIAVLLPKHLYCLLEEQLYDVLLFCQHFCIANKYREMQ